MVRLKRQHRQVLVDRLPELGNFGVGSLLFGQFLADRPFSHVLFRRGGRMMFFFVVMGGIIAVVSVVAVLDWQARKKDAAARRHSA